MDSNAGDRTRHEQASGFHHKIKRMKTIAPFTVTELTRDVRSMISAYPEGKLKKHLTKAVPNMFIFLSYPGMPSHNAAELAIWNGSVRAVWSQVARLGIWVDFQLCLWCKKLDHHGLDRGTLGPRP